MRPIFAKSNRRTLQQLLDLRRDAQRDKAPRVVLRIQGIPMSLEGYTPGEIAQRLKVHRSTVPDWIHLWNEHGQEALGEGHRSGRRCRLAPQPREKLCAILDSGPLSQGLGTGIWTSPLVGQIIRDEFGHEYHPGHVRKLLKQLGYSVQRPTTRLVQADQAEKRKWVRNTYPNLKKTPKVKGR